MHRLPQREPVSDEMHCRVLGLVSNGVHCRVLQDQCLTKL